MVLKGSKAFWVDIIFLTIVFCGLYFILLGSRPLFVPDEGRYAEIVREMVENRDFITPTLNGIKYFEKPVLFYWLEAASIKIGGLNLWALRTPNAFLALLGCLLTYLTARKLYDRTTSLLSALIFGTSTLYFVMSHMISLDLPVTLFLTACLYFFLLGISQENAKNHRFFFWGAAVTSALAVLTKGLIGIVFPIIIIGSFIVLTRQWIILKRSYLFSSLIIFLLIVVPWHWLVAQKNPEFFYFYFIEQHFLRYTNPDVGHYNPAWFFIPCLMAGFFPWIIFLPQAIYSQCVLIFKNRCKYQTDLYFLIWFVVIFAFFSLSKSKLIPYILPIFPPLAILTARYLRALLLKPKTTLDVKISYFILAVVSFCIAFMFIELPTRIPMTNPKQAAIYLNLAALFILTGSLLACLFAYFSLKKALIITIMTTALFLLSTLAALPYIDTRTVLPFAQKLKPILTPQDEIITYNQYYQDLPFYLERRVSILNWHNELSYGMQFQDTKAWMINDDIFWQRWHSAKRVFVVLDAGRYQELINTHPNDHFYLLGQTPNNVLITNHSV